MNNNTIRLNKFNKFGGSKKKKGGMPKTNDTGKGKKGKNYQGIDMTVSGNAIIPAPPSYPKPSNQRRRKLKQDSENQTYAKLLKGSSVIISTQEEPHEHKTTRSISLIDTSESEKSNFIEELLKKNTNYFDVNSVYAFSSICPKKDGTPQKRLLYLAIACLNILDGDPFKNYGYERINPNQRKEYKELINFMQGIKEDENEVADSDDASRGWWGKTANIKYLTSLNNLVNLIIDRNSSQKNKSWSEDMYKKIICSFQLIIDVKSISDNSQVGQLVNFIPNLISPGGHNTENANISNIIKRDAKIGFDSADKICIGTSAILVDALPFPVTTMCPRKCSMGGRNIQNIIIQKGIIAALAITINILWNEEGISARDASDLLSNYYDFNNEHIIEFINNLLKIITVFKENHIKSNFRNFNMNDLYNYGFKIKLRWEEDELVSSSIFLNYENDWVFNNLSELTKNIKNLLNNNLEFLTTARDNLFKKKQYGLLLYGYTIYQMTFLN
jgi:hypothetical protein